VVKTKKKKVLIIEDDETISEVLRMLFEKKGLKPRIVADGIEGFKEAKRMKPDLIVLDLMLPGQPGEEVCKAIREDADKDLAHVPIIITSAKSSHADQVIGRVLGASRYLTKPLVLSEVNETIDLYLNS
jgi:DNA-binding response OmpR family regulator